MKFIDTLSLSTRMFKTRPMRTFLTILGVSIGIGAVLFLVSLGYGLQNSIISRITTADSLLSLDVTTGVTNLILLNQKNLDEISKFPEVLETSAVISLTGQITMNGYTADSLINAVDASFFRLDGLLAKYGRIFDSRANNEIVISSAGAKLFNFEPDKIIGQQLSLSLIIPKPGQENDENSEKPPLTERKDKYVIVGVIDDDNSCYLYIPRQSIEDLKIDNFSQLKVKVKNTSYMEKIRGEIINRGFIVSALSDTIDQANKIFRIVQIVLACFGIVALFVSAIGMFNTMTIALLERINEIGIMRAIGVTKRDLMFLFLIESSLMGLLGGIGGIVVGFLAGKAANFGLNLMAHNFGGQSLNLFYSPPWFIAVIIIFSAVIGFLTGVYPSVRASRINPLEALKYK
jgi:putative ABC transport system permease protein